MKEQIIKAIQKATGIKEINLEFPENEGFGDFTTNIALGEENPRQFAEKLVKKLQKDKALGKIVEKIEIAGPARLPAGQGFINFWLTKSNLVKELREIVNKKNKYGSGKFLSGQKLMLEFAHPNTHKLFQIGHLRNIATGEAISRILEASGVKVVRVNYQGDVGLHIAKCLWGIEKLDFKDPRGIDERVNFLGEGYKEGNRAYEENKKAKGEIENINGKLYKAEDEKLMEKYRMTRQLSLDYFDKIYHRLDTKFDRLYFESETADLGREIALKALQKKILLKSEGAVIFPGEKFGLHNRVFINSKGVPTYEAKDLGLAKIQFGEFRPDKILHVVAPEQSGYFQVLFRAMKDILPEYEGKEIHLVYGWVRLKEGKMSSREGNVVLGEWLLDEAKKEIIKTFKCQDDIAEKVAVGAVKYSFLKVGMNQDIAFDLRESVSLEGNSGPYLQYTVVRCQSVLAKARSTKHENTNVSNFGFE